MTHTEGFTENLFQQKNNYKTHVEAGKHSLYYHLLSGTDFM